jgi:hypothetical protein
MENKPIFEVIGGTKEWRKAIKKKVAKELDPKLIYEPNNRRVKK